MHTFVVVKKVPGVGLGGNANLELLRNLFGGLGAGGFGAPANQSNGKCFLILFPLLRICTVSAEVGKRLKVSS